MADLHSTATTQARHTPRFPLVVQQSIFLTLKAFATLKDTAVPVATAYDTQAQVFEPSELEGLLNLLKPD